VAGAVGGVGTAEDGPALADPERFAVVPTERPEIVHRPVVEKGVNVEQVDEGPADDNAEPTTTPAAFIATGMLKIPPNVPMSCIVPFQKKAW
jgi:hypothetical protein